MAWQPTDPPQDPRYLPEFLSRTLREIYGALRQEKVFQSGPIWTTGRGSPESVVAAPVGSLYTRLDGGVNTTLYVKESGTGNTGWVNK